ncbi:hypothetical protein BGZ72_008037 [Mortierella alpina]|nr:hypothetical protein BGZ72_008037 [Mortierella alpina]
MRRFSPTSFKRSQGYIIAGVNEYYTSKRCPKWEEFVGQVEIRLPSWAKDRLLHKFKMQLRDDWDPRVTDLYEAAMAKPILDHIHIDEIALEIKTITREILESFYNQKMKEENIQRAHDAALLWANWVQKWKTLLLNEKVAAQRENRDSVEAVDTEPVVEEILSSYTECKSKKTTKDGTGSRTYQGH